MRKRSEGGEGEKARKRRALRSKVFSIKKEKGGNEDREKERGKKKDENKQKKFMRKRSEGEEGEEKARKMRPWRSKVFYIKKDFHGHIFENEYFATSEDRFGVRNVLAFLHKDNLATDERRAAMTELVSIVSKRCSISGVGRIGFLVLWGVLHSYRFDLVMVRGAMKILLRSLGPSDSTHGATTEVDPPSWNLDIIFESMGYVYRLSVDDFHVKCYTLQLFIVLITHSPRRLKKAFQTYFNARELLEIKLEKMLMDHEVLREGALLILNWLQGEVEEIQKSAAFEVVFANNSVITKVEEFLVRGVGGDAFKNENSASSEDRKSESFHDNGFAVRDLLDFLDHDNLAADERRAAITELESIVEERCKVCTVADIIGPRGFRLLMNIIRFYGCDLVMVKGALKILERSLGPFDNTHDATTKIQQPSWNIGIIFESKGFIYPLMGLLSEDDFHVRCYTLRLLKVLIKLFPMSLKEAFQASLFGRFWLEKMLKDCEVIRDGATLIVNWLQGEAEDFRGHIFENECFATSKDRDLLFFTVWLEVLLDVLVGVDGSSFMILTVLSTSLVVRGASLILNWLQGETEVIPCRLGS